MEAVPQGDRLATAVVTKHCPAGTSSITKGAPEVLSAPLWRAGPVRSVRVVLREVCRARLIHTTSEAPATELR